MSELPKGWVATTLGDVCEINPRDHAPSDDTEVSFVPMAAVSEITGAIAAPQVRRGGEVRKGFTPFADGDVLFAKITPCMENGKAAVARGLVNGRGYGSTEFFVLRSRGGVIPEFVHKFVRQEDYRRSARTTMKSGVGQARVPRDFVESTRLNLPPVNEQRRIVAKLEALQARSRRAREALDAVPSLLEKLRQSILAAAFRGDLTKDWRAKNKDIEPASKLLERIRTERRKKWEEAELAKLKAKGKPPTDDKWKSKYKEPVPLDTTGLPELPEGWCWAAWREVGFSQNGRAFPSSEYSDDGEKLLRPGNLHVSGQLEWTATNTRRMPRKWAREFPEFVVGENELVMNLTAQSLKDEFLGRVCLSRTGERCLLNQRIARLTPVGLPIRYWLWLFKSPTFRRYVDTLNTGSLIQHMFTSQLEEFAVPIMPVDEANVLVERISARLEVARAMTMLVDEQRARLPEVDRAVLAKAFRGELVPQDPSDEPAEVMLARLQADVPAPSTSKVRSPKRKAS